MAAAAVELGTTRSAVGGFAKRNGIVFGGNSTKARRLRGRGPRRASVPPPVRLSGRVVRKDTGRGCRFIHGDPAVKPVAWCDAPVERPGGAWCEEHHAVVYQAGPPARL